jgi:hypothetical protein
MLYLKPRKLVVVGSKVRDLEGRVLGCKYLFVTNKKISGCILSGKFHFFQRVSGLGCSFMSRSSFYRFCPDMARYMHLTTAVQ